MLAFSADLWLAWSGFLSAAQNKRSFQRTEKPLDCKRSDISLVMLWYGFLFIFSFNPVYFNLVFNFIFTTLLCLLNLFRLIIYWKFTDSNRLQKSALLFRSVLPQFSSSARKYSLLLRNSIINFYFCYTSISHGENLKFWK